MPLTRYQIRNEYSLADPELYRAADKDDPEALLEGVAMAGLVGVLRQLGDLAEFAAEIFHDLHEEVMATAARGHGLMVRVQQLEAEFPSIEKAFLSQTNHLSFFSNTGVDWHPNLRTEQNLITRGDLPRCVMDSYEECRGPPRLFLLDKFDVAGAGACLKRYTDPSSFKVESASSGNAKMEFHREKKIRKAKKKGPRWRNGDTPEVTPTSHAKLHQLFLEERIVNAYSDPARLVKLKRRQLNGSPLDPKYGKSYMEKFLETPSPEHKAVDETSVTPPLLRLISDNSSESGLEIHDISMISPVKKSSQGKETICSSPNARKMALVPSMDQMNGEVIDREIVKLPEPAAIIERETAHHKVTTEKELLVDGDHSDDMTSEVDNYVDALTTMESETDNEYRPKNDPSLSIIGNLETYSDANDEQLEVQAHFSDSQSIGISSTSDDGNSSLKKGRSSFSYSDTISNLAENAPSDGEEAASVLPSAKNFATEIVDTSPLQFPPCTEMLSRNSTEVLSNSFLDGGRLSDGGEASCSSYLTESNTGIIPQDRRANSVVPSVEQDLDEVPSGGIKLDSEVSVTDENGPNPVDSLDGIVIDPSGGQDDTLFTVSPERNSLDDSGEPNVSSDTLHPLSNMSQLASESKTSDDPLDEVSQTDHAEENYAENSMKKMISFPKSTISAIEEQVPCSTSPELEDNSVILLCSDSLNAVKPDNWRSEVNDALPEAGENPEYITPLVDTSQIHSFNDQLLSEELHDAPHIGVDSMEMGIFHSEKKTNIDEVSEAADAEEIGRVACGADDVSLDLPPTSSDAGLVDPAAETTSGEAADAEEIGRVASEADIVEEDDVSLDLLPTSSDAGLVDPAAETTSGEAGGAEGIGRVSCKSDVVEEAVISLDLPPTSPHVGFVGPPTERASAEAVTVSTATGSSPGSIDDIESTLSQSSNIICSSSMHQMDWQESQQERLEFNEVISQECLSESEAEKIGNQAENALTVTEANSQENLVEAEAKEMNQVEVSSTDPICSSSMHRMDWQELQQERLEFNEVISQECLSESEAEKIGNPAEDALTVTEANSQENLVEAEAKEMNQVEVSSTDPDSIDRKPGSYNHSNFDVKNASLIEPTRNSFSVDDVTTAPAASSEPTDQELESKFLDQSPCPGDNERMSSNTCYLTEPGISLEQSLGLQTDQPDERSLQEDEGSSNSLNLLIRQKQPLDHINQEMCLYASGSHCPEDHTSQVSTSELLPLSINDEPDDNKQQKDLPVPSLPSFGLLPVVTQVSMEEMPPLPPLPPMQWRLGKFQHASTVHSELGGQWSIPMDLQYPTEQNLNFGLSASEGGIVQSGNPFLPPAAVEEEKCHHVSEQLAISLPPNASSPYNGISLGRSQLSNPFITLPVLSNGKPGCASLAMDVDHVQSSKPFSPVPAVEYTARYDPVSLHEKPTQPPNQWVLDTGLESEIIQHHVQNTEVQQETPANISVLLPTEKQTEVEDHPPTKMEKQTEVEYHPPTKMEKQNEVEEHPRTKMEKQSEVEEHPTTKMEKQTEAEEQPQHGLLTSDGEMAQTSTAFVKQQGSSISEVPWQLHTFALVASTGNGNSTVKLPRPRNPLIDAVAAHDKSKLRKVTERVRPQITPKLDERDSLLEQIRTKSFNLKPAVVTRPNIQGPKTNLKVAAILEKANAIRQALAGSDEDDDEDGWSDS